MTSLRWEDYFLKSGDAFHNFWKNYQLSQNRDFLFIIGLGFDPRMCLAVEKILQNEGKGARDCFLIEYEEGEGSPSNDYKTERRDNLKKIEEIFKKFGKVYSNNIKMRTSDDRLVGGRNAANLINSIELHHYTDIIVDISALPRTLYFPIIGKLLALYDIAVSSGARKFNLHVVVAESPIMDINIQAEGIEKSADYIHGFSGEADLIASGSIPRIWIPILGEEKTIMLQKIYDLVEPQEICPIVPFPSKNPRRGDEIILQYNRLLFETLRVEPTNILYSAEQNPFDVYRKIARTSQQYHKSLSPLGGCKIIVSSTSSKLLSIGALLAAWDSRNWDIGYQIGIAQVEAQGYRKKDKTKAFQAEQAELFTLWLAGECYDTE